MTVIEEEINQSHTNTITADDILKGKILIDQLPEPYLIVKDSQPGMDAAKLDKLSKVINILAIKGGYRVVSFALAYAHTGYVIMEKKDNNNKEKK